MHDSAGCPGVVQEGEWEMNALVVRIGSPDQPLAGTVLIADVLLREL